MIRPRTNASEVLRQLGVVTSGKDSIYHKAGAQLKSKLLEEFETLVRETPQWSGTTAASWEIGFYRDITGEVETQPRRSLEEALQKGSEPACQIAIHKAQTSIPDDLSQIKTQDIIVSNESPGYDTAEDGPVRAVNTPPGALARFEARVAALDFDVDLYKVS